MRTAIHLLVVFLVFAGEFSLVFAEPTEEREWTSTANTTFKGKAISLSDGKVSLESSEGRNLTVALNKLVEADQKFLKKHFMGKLPSAPELVAPNNLPGEQGKMLGPIDAGDGSSYFLYLPKTLSNSYAPPLFFWTGAGKSNAKTLQPFVEAAELTGMAMAASVEASNKNENVFETNHQHTKRCLEHLATTFNYDEERIFFSGLSGGGATAFFNANLIPCAGVFSYVAYIPGGKTPRHGDYFYVAGGAWDYNRYNSSHAAKVCGKNTTHRLYPGGHRTDRQTIPTEGILWLYSGELYGERKEREDEILQFESRCLNYLRELAETKPHLAYYWCDHLLNRCEVSGPLQVILSELSSEVESEGKPYLTGRKALEEFSEKHFAELGGASLGGHTTPAIQKAAKGFLEEFGDVVEVGEIGKELLKETAKF